VKTTELSPSHPERICWGCDRYCPANDLVCGNGTIRTPHPSELFGKDWERWARDRTAHRSDHEDARRGTGEDAVR
jgi:hypothetical protein